MFTGIVQGIARIERIEQQTNLHRLAVQFPQGSMDGITRGASVAIDGACLTVTEQDRDRLWFDVMMETLRATTLGQRHEGDAVNFERAARIGDEIGGHLLSGHVHCTATLDSIETPENNRRLEFRVPQQWRHYLLPKGYIAVNGASLTIGEVSDTGFSVYLIPETLEATTFSHLAEGDSVNLEIDSQTQTIVDTLARLSLKPATD